MTTLYLTNTGNVSKLQLRHHWHTKTA